MIKVFLFFLLWTNLLKAEDDLFYRCSYLFDSKKYLIQNYQYDQKSSCEYSFSLNDVVYKKGTGKSWDCDFFMKKEIRRGFVCISSEFF